MKVFKVAEVVVEVAGVRIDPNTADPESTVITPDGMVYHCRQHEVLDIGVPCPHCVLQPNDDPRP
jgi:hypothetical protein